MKLFNVAKKYGSRAMVAATASVLPVLSFAQATTPETKIGEALTTILAIVAVGGAALIGVALAKVGWTAGAKWISRLGSRG